MFSYNLTTKPTFNISNNIIDNIFKVVSKRVIVNQVGTLNIIFMDDNSIQNLNKKYRNIDKSTDVLSFHYFENFDKIDKSEIAGEIIMSENKIKLQALEYGLGEEKEFYKLLIHSILHIIGYDHEKDDDYKIMQNLENIIWEDLSSSFKSE